MTPNIIRSELKKRIDEAITKYNCEAMCLDNKNEREYIVAAIANALNNPQPTIASWSADSVEVKGFEPGDATRYDLVITHTGDRVYVTETNLRADTFVFSEGDIVAMYSKARNVIGATHDAYQAIANHNDTLQTIVNRVRSKNPEANWWTVAAGLVAACRYLPLDIITPALTEIRDDLTST